MSAFDLLRIYREAVAAVEPHTAVVRALSLDGDMFRAGEFSYDLAGIARIVVVGAGKAAAGMATGVEQVLGGRVESGLVIVKDGYTGDPGRIAQVEAGHPLPDERGTRAAARILDFVSHADSMTLVICLLSGGASALLVSPARGITLEDKIRTTDLLLASGADIVDINTVRKHLSAIKGGQLAAQARPARVLTLALSDVIGDRLDVIGSGPTFPGRSTFSDARAVLERRGLLKQVPPAVRNRLDRRALCVIPETPKPGNPLFDGVGHCIVGNNRLALEAAAASASAHGYDAVVLSLLAQSRRAAALSHRALDPARRDEPADRGPRPRLPARTGRPSGAGRPRDARSRHIGISLCGNSRFREGSCQGEQGHPDQAALGACIAIRQVCFSPRDRVPLAIAYRKDVDQQGERLNGITGGR